MSKFNFTATHGVSLWDLGVQFTKADDEINPDGSRTRVYAFGTDDKATADALAKVEGYGIKRAEPTEPEPEPVAENGPDEADSEDEPTEPEPEPEKAPRRRGASQN